jgi:uncharacterized iron-regulated protein
MSENKRRLKSLEKYKGGQRTAFFKIYRGKASGNAWWRDDLSWENLSKPEYESLIEKLKSEGVEILTLNYCIESESGWDNGQTKQTSRKVGK